MSESRPMRFECLAGDFPPQVKWRERKKAPRIHSIGGDRIEIVACTRMHEYVAKMYAYHGDRRWTVAWYTQGAVMSIATRIEALLNGRDDPGSQDRHDYVGLLISPRGLVILRHFSQSIQEDSAVFNPWEVLNFFQAILEYRARKGA